MNGSPQIIYLLTAWALANKSLDMIAHVLPALALACQLRHGSLDTMVADDLIVRCDYCVVYLFRGSELHMEIEVFLERW